MASAWGNSWGVAWGHAWDIVTPVPPTPLSGGSGGIGIRRHEIDSLYDHLATDERREHARYRVKILLLLSEA